MISEYSPYGELLVEELGSTWSQPYRFNAKELDDETGLYYYGARYYDPRLSVWHGTDPKERDYPNISSYAYCHGNPVNRIDLWGMDDYTINEKGYIKKTNSIGTHFDRLLFNNDKSKSVVINDKNLLKQFEYQRDDYEGHYASTHSLSDASKLFKFVADYTNVEWGIDGYKDNGSSYYIIKTTHDSDLKVNYTKKQVGNMTFKLHSHPKKGGNDEASGNYGNIPKNAHKISSRYTTGDQKVLLMIYSLYDEIHPNKNRPNAFIYNARTHNIFKYDVFNPRIGAIKISNSLQLQRILR